jgi:hypothetical protein
LAVQTARQSRAPWQASQTKIDQGADIDGSTARGFWMPAANSYLAGIDAFTAQFLQTLVWETVAWETVQDCYGK